MIRAYAGLGYALFLGTLVYFVGWLADTGVPRGIGDGRTGGAVVAVAVDLALLAAFAVQHSVMARPWWKRAVARFVPRPSERATYVLAATLVVLVLMWQWHPVDATVWTVRAQPWRDLLWAGYGLGWVVVVLSTFMIGHLGLFGVAQAARGDGWVEPGFGTPGFYALVRHPIMTGFLVAFWSTPDMTAGRLLFAGASTAYVVLGVRLEERDLRAHLGPAYVAYAAEVPRFVPVLRRRRGRRRSGPAVSGSAGEESSTRASVSARGRR